MLPMNNKVFKTSTTDLFRCVTYDDVFKNIYNSFLNKKFKDEIILKSGAASGKSEHITNQIVFWLPEIFNSEAIVVTGSFQHNIQTQKRFIRILQNHGYSDYKLNNDILVFGNNNSINFVYSKSGSHDETTEKLKTFTTQNANVKFIWFEEFTSVINSYGNYERYNYSVSRLFREARKDLIVLYSYNALPVDGSSSIPNSKHPIKKFEEFKIKSKNTIINNSTIYDLPKKWQSYHDLKIAEELKNVDNDLFRNIYLGEDIVKSGSIYPILPKVAKVSDFDYVLAGIDEGRVDAISCVLVGVKGDNYHIIEQFYKKSDIMIMLDEYYNFREWIGSFDFDIVLTCETSPGFFFNTAFNDADLPKNVIEVKPVKKQLVRTDDYSFKSFDNLGIIEQRIIATNILLKKELLTISSKNLQIYEAFKEAVRDKKGKRRDDGYSDIDSLDSFEYAIQTEIKYILEILTTKGDDD